MSKYYLMLRARSSDTSAAQAMLGESLRKHRDYLRFSNVVKDKGARNAASTKLNKTLPKPP